MRQWGDDLSFFYFLVFLLFLKSIVRLSFRTWSGRILVTQGDTDAERRGIYILNKSEGAPVGILVLGRLDIGVVAPSSNQLGPLWFIGNVYCSAVTSSRDETCRSDQL